MSVRAAVTGLVLAALGAFPAAAASMSGSVKQLVPNSVNSAGQGGHASANYKLIGTMGEAAQDPLSSAHHFVENGFAALQGWPRTPLQVDAASGAAAGSIVLSFVAPSADGSTGTARAYVIRYSTRPDVSPALSETQFWLSRSATDFIVIPPPATFGTTEQITVTGLVGGASYYFAVKSSSSWDGWGYLSPGATAFASLYMPGVVASTFSSIQMNSLQVQWASGTQPADFNRGGLPYGVEASPNENFTGVVATSVTYALNAVLPGLDPNTTYYVRVCSRIDLSSSGFRVSGATSTLAQAPGLLGYDYLYVYPSSATLQWAALAPGAPVHGSEGYRLEGTPTVFDDLALLRSSFTTDFRVSTLTVAGLDLSSTYYFRVGSLNHNSVPNYTTLTRLNLQIKPSASLVSLGTLDTTLYPSTVSVTPIQVTNVGNIPVTLSVWGSTATPSSSPWSLGISSGEEVAVLEGLWNTVQPSPASFSAPITASTTTSGSPGGAYAGDQDGVAVAPGETVTMWFKFWSPTSTVSTANEVLRVDYQAGYP